MKTYSLTVDHFHGMKSRHCYFEGDARTIIKAVSTELKRLAARLGISPLALTWGLSEVTL